MVAVEVQIRWKEKPLSPGNYPDVLLKDAWERRDEIEGFWPMEPTLAKIAKPKKAAILERANTFHK